MAGFNLLLEFINFIKSFAGIVTTFTLFFFIALWITNYIINEKKLSNNKAIQFTLITIIAIVFLIYGMGSWSPLFLFSVPIWNNTIMDNILAIFISILIIVYSSIILAKSQEIIIEFQKKSNTTNIYIISTFLITAIIMTLIYDYYNIPLIFIGIGIIFIAIHKVSKNTKITGNILILSGSIGFIFMAIFGNFIAKDYSIIASIIVLISSMAVIKKKRKKNIIRYCKLHPNDNKCSFLY